MGIIGEDALSTIGSPPIKDYSSPEGVIELINKYRQEYKLPTKEDRDNYVLVLEDKDVDPFLKCITNRICQL